MLQHVLELLRTIMTFYWANHENQTPILGFLSLDKGEADAGFDESH